MGVMGRKRKKRRRNRKVVGDVLYQLFDYRTLYLIRTTASKGRFKVGIGKNEERRLRQIDRSIRGSKEWVDFSVKLFWASWYEGKLHDILEGARRPWKGSGRTEWHDTPLPWRWIPGGGFVYGWLLREKVRWIMIRWWLFQMGILAGLFFLAGLAVLVWWNVYQGEELEVVLNNIWVTIKTMIYG